MTSIVLFALGFAATSPPSDTCPRVASRHDLQIGAIDDGFAALTAISSIAVDEAGTIFIAQPQTSQIKVFDERGRPVTHIGGRGRGPGEFVQALAIGLAGDSIWVSDPQLRRVSFFTLGGRLLRTVSIDSRWTDGRRTVTGGLPLRRGGFLALLRTSAGGGPEEAADSVPVVFLEANGAPYVPLHVRGGGGMATLRLGERVFAFSNPLDDSPIKRVSPDGEFVYILERERGSSSKKSESNLYRLDRLGRRLWTSRLHLEPAPVPEPVKQQILDNVREVARDIPVTAIARAFRFEAASPTVDMMFVDPPGRAWLRLTQGTTQTGAKWLVVSPEGKPVCQVILRAAETPLYISSSALYTSRTDDLGVEYLRRYPISFGGHTR